MDDRYNLDKQRNGASVRAEVDVPCLEQIGQHFRQPGPFVTLSSRFPELKCDCFRDYTRTFLQSLRCNFDQQEENIEPVFGLFVRFGGEHQWIRTV